MKKYLYKGSKSEMIVTIISTDEKFSVVTLPNGEQITVLNSQLTDL